MKNEHLLLINAQVIGMTIVKESRTFHFLSS